MPEFVPSIHPGDPGLALLLLHLGGFLEDPHTMRISLRILHFVCEHSLLFGEEQELVDVSLDELAAVV